MDKHLRTMALFFGLFSIVLAGSWGLLAAAVTEGSVGETARVCGVHDLNGARAEAKVVEVRYELGGYFTGHSHRCTVVNNVGQGAIRSQVNDEPEGVYKAGETFYETPSGMQSVSANASKTEPAKLVAFFLCDHQTPSPPRP
jgi:quercetin dioxygenase-like cupin family protein